MDALFGTNYFAPVVTRDVSPYLTSLNAMLLSTQLGNLI